MCKTNNDRHGISCNVILVTTELDRVYVVLSAI